MILHSRGERMKHQPTSITVHSTADNVPPDIVLDMGENLGGFVAGFISRFKHSAAFLALFRTKS